MSRSLSILVLLFSFSWSVSEAQSLSAGLSTPHDSGIHYQRAGFLPAHIDTSDDPIEIEDYPEPKSVMYKSMMIPGWGQIQNRQIWKVPVIYGLLGGLTWYSIQLTKSYHDYRAAYYNINNQTPDDERFGPTPDYIPENANLESLRTTRNALRNQRDFIYVALGLAYGLNVIDAYVFAHMRTFDVSEDLSMRTTVKPAVMAEGSPGLTLSIDLFNKSKTR